MANKGFSPIGLSTLDLDKTVEFYQDVLASG
jgi:catechol 2,3-dioxygenase-like lactoylglutathione lyase family enzyme